MNKAGQPHNGMIKYAYRAVVMVVISYGACFASEFEQKTAQFLNRVKNSTRDACVAVADTSGHYIINYNTNALMIPASILKIPLASAAMDYLKPDYRFYTEIHTDKKTNLLLKGYGDPYLVSEEIAIIAGKLSKKNRSSFRSITIDSTSFRDEPVDYISDTNNPYDAINGALSVNFNTIYIGKDSRGRVYSAERQTPLTDTARAFGELMGANDKTRFNTGRDKQTHERHATELFREIFARNAVYIDQINDGADPSKFTLLLRHYNTRNLSEIVGGLMKYSNNFIANQIMMGIGAKYYGFPTDLRKGVRAFKKITAELSPNLADEYHFVEASGLSRENRVTCNFMIQSLIGYKRYRRTLPFKSSSYYKTGSLKGIHNLAGYIKLGNRLYPFVMILYTAKNERFALMKKLEGLIRLKFRS